MLSRIISTRIVCSTIYDNDATVSPRQSDLVLLSGRFRLPATRADGRPEYHQRERVPMWTTAPTAEPAPAANSALTIPANTRRANYGYRFTSGLPLPCWSLTAVTGFQVMKLFITYKCNGEFVPAAPITTSAVSAVFTGTGNNILQIFQNHGAAGRDQCRRPHAARPAGSIPNAAAAVLHRLYWENDNTAGTNPPFTG